MIAVDSTTKTTIIQSQQWGRLEIDEDEVICFNRGLPGFDQLRRFAIFDSEDMKPFKTLKVQAKKTDGTTIDFEVLCRLDSAIEVEYYRNGGILHYVLRQFLNA